MPGDDDLLDEVMRQLGAALGDLDAAKLRDAVKEGLDEALGALEEATQPPPQRADGKPHVVVLDGGLSEEGMAPEPIDTPHRPEVQIEVVRGLDDGWVAPDAAPQPLYVGADAATYRIAVSSGVLEVLVDGDAVATVAEGQSVDVQGRRIAVRGAGRGSYRPVPSSRST